MSVPPVSPKRPSRPPTPRAGVSRARGWVAKWITERQAQRRYVFSLDDLAVLGLPVARLYPALRRLVRQRQITVAGKRRGLWIIVPPEYHDAGAPPATWVIDDIMQALGHPYYIGLRSAAESYGATHHALQALHVVTSARLRPFLLGRQTIRFIQKTDLAGTPTRIVSGPVTALRYSTPEATALDLVRFDDAAGGMHMVAAVLQQICHHCRVDAMRVALETSDDPKNAQRLGYLWALIGAEALARSTDTWLRRRSTRLIWLDRPTADAPSSPLIDARWKVRVAHPLERSL